LIRPAAAADVPKLGPIEVAAGQRFLEVGLPEVAGDDPPGDDAYAEAVADHRIWVAEVAGEVVGYAWAIDLDGQPHLEQLSVRPEHNGTGLGSALIDVVADWARRLGAASLTLSTFAEVAFNGPFYARRGFVVVPTQQHGDRFEALRRHEAELGLDVDARVIMRREL
jgi:GNAT superfamily N-acetyltransferase